MIIACVNTASLVWTLIRLCSRDIQTRPRALSPGGAVLSWCFSSGSNASHHGLFSFPLVLHLMALAASTLKALFVCRAQCECGLQVPDLGSWEPSGPLMGWTESWGSSAALTSEMSSQVWNCTSGHSSCSGKTPISACVALFAGSPELPWYVGASSCRWLNGAVWAAACPAGQSLLSLPINTGAFVSGLIVALPSQSPFCALPPAQASVFGGLFFSCSLSPGVYCACCRACLFGREEEGLLFVWGL